MSLAIRRAVGSEIEIPAQSSPRGEKCPRCVSIVKARILDERGGHALMETVIAARSVCSIMVVSCRMRGLRRMSVQKLCYLLLISFSLTNSTTLFFLSFFSLAPTEAAEIQFQSQGHYQEILETRGDEKGRKRQPQA